MNARISEIFDSVQGEGIYLGERQLFVRFFEYIVVGLYDYTSEAEKIAEIPGVDYILGNMEKQEIAAWVSTGEKRDIPVIVDRGVLPDG